MFMRFIIIISIILSLIGLPGASALAQESGAEGEITGQVVNGTEGGGSVEGTAVTLLTYVDNTLAATETISADAEGRFRFDQVATEHSYLVSARYMDVNYYYPADFAPGETAVNVKVGVCDTTTGAGAIRTGVAHTVFSIGEETVEVTEMYQLYNDGDMTYVGTDGVLVFNLPEGAYDFNAPQETVEDYRFIDDDTLTYMVPFPPGNRQLVYSYRLARPDTAEFTIPLRFKYPVDGLDVMVAGEGIEVAAPALAPAEPVVTDAGQRYLHFQGSDLPGGTVIELRVTNPPAGNSLPLYVIGAVVLLAAGGLVFYLMRRKRRASSAA